MNTLQQCPKTQKKATSNFKKIEVVNTNGLGIWQWQLYPLFEARLLFINYLSRTIKKYL